MNGALLGKLATVLVVAGVSGGVTWAVTDTGSDLITTAGPAAWVDDPLDGSVLESDVGEVTVVAHATDPDGIVEIVLLVDGAEVDSADTGGDDLETADDLRWTPREPGTYELRVIGRNPSGAATPPGIAKVQVGTDEEQPATTTTTTGPADSTSSTEVAAESTTTTAGGSTTTRPVTGTTTATTAPATTTTPTTAPTTTTCVPGTVVNTSPGSGDPVTNPPTLEWIYRGCTPVQFWIEVRDIDGALVATSSVGALQWTTPPLPCPTSTPTYSFQVRAEAGSNQGNYSAPTTFHLVCR